MMCGEQPSSRVFVDDGFTSADHLSVRNDADSFEHHTEANAEIGIRRAGAVHLCILDFDLDISVWLDVHFRT